MSARYSHPINSQKLTQSWLRRSLLVAVTISVVPTHNARTLVSLEAMAAKTICSVLNVIRSGRACIRIRLFWTDSTIRIHSVTSTWHSMPSLVLTVTWWSSEQKAVNSWSVQDVSSNFAGSAYLNSTLTITNIKYFAHSESYQSRLL